MQKRGEEETVVGAMQRSGSAIEEDVGEKIGGRRGGMWATSSLVPTVCTEGMMAHRDREASSRGSSHRTTDGETIIKGNSLYAMGISIATGGVLPSSIMDLSCV